MLYEDDMLNTYDIVPCRGREAGPITNRAEAFTQRELDAIAPLLPRDAKELGEFSIPDPETLARVAKRIEAARVLKYGR